MLHRDSDFVIKYVLGCLTPPSTIVQLYHGSFYYEVMLSYFNVAFFDYVQMSYISVHLN
jgi:hypothetical protein